MFSDRHLGFQQPGAAVSADFAGSHDDRSRVAPAAHEIIAAGRTSARYSLPPRPQASPRHLRRASIRRASAIRSLAMWKTIRVSGAVKVGTDLTVPDELNNTGLRDQAGERPCGDLLSEIVTVLPQRDQAASRRSSYSSFRFRIWRMGSNDGLSPPERPKGQPDLIVS